MSSDTPRPPDPGEDDRSERPDIKAVVEAEPYVDTDGELDDSADSYVSPARTDEPSDR